MNLSASILPPLQLHYRTMRFWRKQCVALKAELAGCQETRNFRQGSLVGPAYALALRRYAEAHALWLAANAERTARRDLP